MDKQISKNDQTSIDKNKIELLKQSNLYFFNLNKTKYENKIDMNELTKQKNDFLNGIEFANITNLNSFDLNVVFELFDIENKKSIDFVRGYKYEQKRLSKKFNEFLNQQ